MNTSKPVMVSSSSLVLLSPRWIMLDLTAERLKVSVTGRPGPGLMALDLATNEEGVEGLEEFEWV